jgi:SAM-dependent methyltransferase
MKSSDRVRRAYELRPYPYGNQRALRSAAWSLDLDWVRTFGGIREAAWPRRVLVAGCGDGSEAFALARRLPAAEFVAVDFSRRSIALARTLQRRDGGLRRIRFEVADLTAPGLAGLTGGDFDFICCHGVLSYVPQLGRAFSSLRQCLSPGGVLYIGVNGASHVGLRLRGAFPQLGLELNKFRADRRTDAVLRMADAVLADEGFPRVADLGAAYLSSDVFGTPNHCLALEEWLRRARAAGLHFRSSAAALRLCRRIEESGQTHVLVPGSRADVSGLLDAINPSQFHRLLFARSPEASPAWNDRQALLGCTVERSGLYRIRLPARRGPVRDRVRTVRVTGSFMNVKIEWRMPEWEMEVLRQADAGRLLGQILAGLPLAIPLAAVRQQFFLLHQLGVVTLRPGGPG